MLQNLTLKKVRKNRKKFGLAERAEIKLLAGLVYFILVTVLMLAADTYTTAATPELYLNALLPYFACESVGQDGNCQSLLSNVQRPNLYNLSVTSIVLLGFLPLVVFLFSNNFKLYITKCTRN